MIYTLTEDSDGTVLVLSPRLLQHDLSWRADLHQGPLHECGDESDISGTSSMKQELLPTYHPPAVLTAR